MLLTSDPKVLHPQILLSYAQHRNAASKGLPLIICLGKYLHIGLKAKNFISASRTWSFPSLLARNPSYYNPCMFIFFSEPHLSLLWKGWSCLHPQAVAKIICGAMCESTQQAAAYCTNVRSVGLWSLLFSASTIYQHLMFIHVVVCVSIFPLKKQTWYFKVESLNKSIQICIALRLLDSW